MNRTRAQVVAVCLAATAVASLSGLAQAASFIYTGGGAAGNWADPLNWGGAGAPVNVNDDATIPNGFSPTFTTGFPATPTLTYFTTGNGLVTLPSSLKMIYQGSPWRSDQVDIGTGGLTIVGSGGVEMSSEALFRSAGPVTMDHLNMVNAAPQQTGSSTWDITTIRLGNNAAINPYYVRNWNIVDGANTTFTQTPSNGSSTRWTGSPVITGGRPQWNLFNAPVNWSQTWGQWDLQSYKLYGDVVQVDGMNGSNPRLIGNGATVDVNTLRIAYGYSSTDGRAYVDLDNSTVLIQGTGTSSLPAWDNRCQRNTLFDMATGTSVTFDPASSPQYVHTGSKDRGGSQASYWNDNFAFYNVAIGAGDTITLTGTANIEGGGNDALYVKGSLSGAGTINANSRNIYVAGSLTPGSSIGTFTVSGGNLAMASGSSLYLELGGTPASGLFDKLVVTGGTLDLSATGDALNITTLPGYYSNVGDTFHFVDYASRNGIFNILQWNGWATNSVFSLSYDVSGGANLTFLVSIPEPASGLLLALAGLAALRRRRSC